MKYLQRWLSGFTAASIVCGTLMYRYRKRITSQTDCARQGVSVIIPARNEAENLPRLLASLAEAEDTEVIVMDDGSTDATRDIAEAYGAKVYAVSDDAEWQGKSHACYEGSLKAQKELFMFVDADVWFEGEDSLKRILAQYQQQGNQGLLSIQPYHHISAPYENLSVVFNLMTIIGMNVFSVSHEKNQSESAFGPVLLTNRADYFRTQGHRNAATQIIEGFALSEAYHQAHLPVRLFEGEGTINFRMYPQGVRSLIAGWSKHFAVGAQNTKSSVMLLIMSWLFGSVASLAQLIAAYSKPNTVTRSQRWCALSLYTLYGLQFYRLGRRTGNFKPWLILAHPVCFAFFIFIFSKSWFDVKIRKSVRWKGRNIVIKK